MEGLTNEQCIITVETYHKNNEKSKAEIARKLNSNVER